MHRPRTIKLAEWRIDLYHFDLLPIDEGKEGTKEGKERTNDKERLQGDSRRQATSTTTKKGEGRRSVTTITNKRSARASCMHQTRTAARQARRMKIELWWCLNFRTNPGRPRPLSDSLSTRYQVAHHTSSTQGKNKLSLVRSFVCSFILGESRVRGLTDKADGIV